MERHAEVIESEITDLEKMEPEHKAIANCNQNFCSQKGQNKWKNRYKPTLSEHCASQLNTRMERDVSCKELTADPSRTSRGTEKKRGHTERFHLKLWHWWKANCCYSLQLGPGKLFTVNNIFSETQPLSFFDTNWHASCQETHHYFYRVTVTINCLTSGLGGHILAHHLLIKLFAGIWLCTLDMLIKKWKAFWLEPCVTLLVLE